LNSYCLVVVGFAILKPPSPSSVSFNLPRPAVPSDLEELLSR
jgi:hypothetical protein